MSQFDFPRINFHGTAKLDTATANNGNYEPQLTLFDQDRSLPYLPPRCYLTQNPNVNPPPGVPVLTDHNGNQYVPVLPINADNFQAWATTPLGSFSADAGFLAFYTQLGINGVKPGYWNYYGDLSMELQDVLVTGITVPGNSGGTVTFTPQNNAGCPPDLLELLGAELSFNLNYGTPNSRTNAFLCDVDSVGQMCTQIFCGTAGLYDSEGNAFFTGSSTKSTARWMNLSRVVNYANSIPMGGSASFYSRIEVESGSKLGAAIKSLYGIEVPYLFMKLLIHEVYEVRNPNYSALPVKTTIDAQGNSINIPKNPAIVSLSGSLTPWNPGDLCTAPLSRILKPVTSLSLDTTNMINPIPMGATQPLGIWSTVYPAPAHFIYNSAHNLISIDLINTINEYGTAQGEFPSFAGNGDIQPFTAFENYNYGDITFYFQPDNGTAVSLGTITFAENYNMAQYLATGGVVDIPVAAADYTAGYFFLTIDNQTVMQEDQVYMTSDQQGMYAEQNQLSAGLYLVDGLPRIPFTLRVLQRGVPVAESAPISVTLQCINMNNGATTQSQVTVYDGCNYTFPVDQDGCLTYVFADLTADLFPTIAKPTTIAAFAMRAYLVVVRVLSANLALQSYTTNAIPLNWQIVFDNIFVLYKTLYPVMDLILPMTEQNWSDPTIQSMALNLTDEKNWALPMFMPVTRDMTTAQRALLQTWIQQNHQPKT